MKHIYNGSNGMVPNIGVFLNGDEVSADVAKRLSDAGYDVTMVPDENTARYGGNAEPSYTPIDSIKGETA